MADKDLNIRVNMLPGGDGMSPVLEKQKEQADALGKAIDDARAKASQPVPLRLAAQGVTQEEWDTARAKGQKIQEANRQQSIMQQVRAEQAMQANGGLIPEAAIQKVQSPGSAAAGQIGGAAAQSVMAVSGALGHLAQSASPARESLNRTLSAFSAIPGPVGIAAGAVGTVVNILDHLGITSERIRPSLSELLERMGQAEGVLGRQRQTGLATARDVLSNLSVGGANAINAAQQTGNNAAVVNIARQEATAAQADVNRLQGQNPQEGQIQLQHLLTRIMDERRAGPLSANQQAAFQGLVAGAWNQFGGGAPMPEQLRNITSNANAATLNPQMVEQLASSISAPLLRAQARLETAQNIARTGFAPSLRAGTPGLDQLPNLFQSRQGDVLDIHQQLQIESVRDQRQERQFEAQMRLWEQILQTLQGNPAAGQGEGGGFWDALRNAVQGAVPPAMG